MNEVLLINTIRRSGHGEHDETVLDQLQHLSTNLVLFETILHPKQKRHRGMLCGLLAIPVTMIHRNAAYCSKMVIRILLAQLASDLRCWK